MNVKELVNYFETHKKAHERGAGFIASRTHSKKEDVIKARKIYKQEIFIGENKAVKLPKILIFDIETAPIKAYVWQLWKANVSLDQIISEWFTICWSAKWLYSNTIMGDCITKEEILKEDDKRIVKSLWKLFDEADIVIAHNARKFDVPKMNAKFIQYGLQPPSPYRIIDTLEVAKKEFKFTSNKLDGLAIHFGYPRKLETDFTLWSECLKGKRAALDYMFKYNKYDVKLLEEIYIKLLPWIKNHPNINLYVEGTQVCCNCGGNDLTLIPKRYYYTQANKYPIYRCNHCGAISRGRQSIGKAAISPTAR